MKKQAVSLMVLALVLGWGATAAFAGPYVSGDVGVVWVEDSDFSYDGDDLGVELSFDSGYGITAALGYATVLDPKVDYYGYRGEVELGYRKNDTDKVSASGLGSLSVDGDASTFSLMANGYIDFLPEQAISPFIGVGIGFANVEGDIDDLGSDDDNVFAWQAIAGVGFAVSEQIKIDVQYRYFGTDDQNSRFMVKM